MGYSSNKIIKLEYLWMKVCEDYITWWMELQRIRRIMNLKSFIRLKISYTHIVWYNTFSGSEYIHHQSYIIDMYLHYRRAINHTKQIQILFRQ